MRLPFRGDANEEPGKVRTTMALTTVRPTKPDRWVASAIASHTNPRTEQAAEVLTWGADAHVLCLFAAGWWLYCRDENAECRRASNHVLLSTLAASLLPHLLKTVFNQERPDRETLEGHFRGIPFSGKKYDAFPSGHAVHIGALASAATLLPPRQRNAVWGIGGALVLTRIILLAHWVSDVAAGLAVGALLERTLRLFTGYGRRENGRNSATGKAATCTKPSATTKTAASKWS
jgi:undecaprenyl-diphosphatase